MRQRIRDVLLNVWDPIGIRDQPAAQDEYDNYITGICGLVSGVATDNEIAEQLLFIVTERMGLQANLEDMRPTVRALRKIQP